MYSFDANPANWRDGELEQDAERAAKILAWLEDGERELETVVGEGAAGDGQIRVTATASGRVREVTLTRRAMRLDSVSLAEEVLLAVHRAQDDAERKSHQLVGDALGEVLPAGAFDPGTLEERLGRVVRSFERP
ncbi:hypothetical protein GCM10022226_58210 [Sphaerisporangium flaviroseum]|uniref:YbaB/EbfC family DNA-binding protein n=1 Tax=Sphaerisporangium flaviroseum TaxID=509199 RepID=A0ABP7IXQ2_9ACTN